MAFIKTRKKIVSSAIASSLSIIAGNAVAQEQVAQLDTIYAEATAKEQSLKVDESANKKYLVPLLDTPKSISVISKQLIEDTQVTTLADALRTVPGITLGAGEGGNPTGDRPFIRGYSSESSMFVDGIRNATSQNREMFAIEQVEVTKGSGSSLAGGGSVGGNVNMISKVAKKGDSLEGSVAAGTDSYARITLDANKDFNNGIAARVALMGHQNEKAGQHEGAEYKRFGIAPSITFGLDTDTRATLSYYYLKTDDTPDSGIPYNNPTPYPNHSGKPIDVKQGIYYGLKDRDFQKQENQIGTIKVEHDITDNLMISNTAVYNRSKNDYVYTQPDDSKGNIYSKELVWQRGNPRVTTSENFTDVLNLSGKFNTGSLLHRFNIGAEYSHQETIKGSYLSTDNSQGSCSGVTAKYCTSLTDPNPLREWDGTLTRTGKQTTTTSETKSIYFLDNIEINKQWLLDLGLRWDKFDSHVLYNKDVKGRGSNVTPKGSYYESESDFWSGNAGLTYKPTENSAIYISYATSAIPVGIDQGDGDESLNSSEQVNNLKPEKARTYEVGTKWDLFDNKLNLTAAIFRTEKQNTRVEVSTGVSANVGESRVDGIELGVNGNITDKWAVSAGYTYLDSELVKAAPSAKANEGLQLPFVPENSATLWTTYNVTPQFTVGAGAFAVDKVYGNKTATTQKYVPGYVRYDAMARYEINKNVNLQLNVNNLSDKRYFSKAFTTHYATEAEGRSAVLAVNFKY